MKIMVTGAAGYLASWIVRQLLEQGCTVHGTVRDLGDKVKIAHLDALSAEFPSQLTLFTANLLQEDGFLAAMQGCDMVIHTAAPYFLQACADPQQQLLDPALIGTKNVLNAVNQTPSVVKVIMTSSIVTLYNDAADQPTPITELQHNTRCTLAETPYAYAKTQAERYAVDLAAAQSRWQLVTLHPGAIFGPSLSRRVDASSVTMMLQFLNGAFAHGVPQLNLGVVDVRDVAQGHLNAAIKPSDGKYLLVAQSLSLLEIAQLMRPQHKTKLPNRELPKPLLWLIAPLIGMTRRYIARNVGFSLNFDTRRSQSELGISYRPVSQTFNEHIQQIESDALLLSQ